MAASVTLLNAAAATGAALAIQIGGDYCFAVNGTFGGCTVALEMLGPDGTNYINTGVSATLTAAGAAIVTLPPGTYRASIAGGAAMTITATLKGVI